MNDKHIQVLGMVTKPLRDALMKYEITEDTVIEKYSKLFKDDKTRPADVIRMIELFSKWTGLAQPEEKKIKVEGIQIGVKEPEDADI